MAYDVNVDYKAKNIELQKQLAAATDPATKAAIQAQIDANDQSRLEKSASDIYTYGKYLNGSELDSAAGIAAQNQIGTGYETQKANLNTSYDQAKQNANNDALSRGMARSTFVSDRMANLDSQRANALTQIDASKALALQNAKANILSDYRTNTANALANEKKEFANTIGAYYNDFQQEINNVQGNNDPSDDWKIPYLQAARNEKLLAQEAAALKAAQKSYSGGGTGGGGGGVVDNTVPAVVFNSGQQSALYAGKLADAAASYQVGMSRTAQGQLATVERLLNAGQITEAQANALIKKFNLG